MSTKTFAIRYILEIVTANPTQTNQHLPEYS